MTTEIVTTPRYHRLDAYTTLELQTAYDTSDREAKIRLLRSVFEAGGQLPYDIASAAVSDADTVLRAWFARNAQRLDYSYDASAGEEANLSRVLRTDPDPLVSLAFLENPQNDAYSYTHPTSNDFIELTHIERLALIRNPRLASRGVPDVVLSIFDTSDTTIVSSEEERAELALAYLTNERAVKQSHNFEYPREIRHDPVSYTFEKDRERLWRLAAAFPDPTVSWHALRYLGAKDAAKAAVYLELQPLDDDEFSYENSRRANLRYAILLNCTETDVKTLALGAKDRDEDCYEMARQKFTAVEEKTVNAWRVAGHVWFAAQNLVVLGVIAAVLGAGETRFENVALATVVYLFITLTAFSLQLFATYRATIVPLDSEFERLRKLLGDKRSSREAEVIAQQRTETRAEFAKANVNHVIASVALSLAWLITFIALIRALLEF